MNTMSTKKISAKPFEKKVWLASPTMHGEELAYVQEAFDKNWITTAGENINECERAMAEYVGVKYAVGLSCGTAALHMAVKLAAEETGCKTVSGAVSKRNADAEKPLKVFCSDVTFDATVNPVVYEGGTPIFIDTEYDTWNMDPVALERAFELHPDVRVIDVAHLYGTPGKIDEIRAIVAARNAVIIEDAAESLGATYKGVQTGSFGDFGCISFNGNKIITGSSGGMFLTNDEEQANLVRKWSTQAREAAPWYQHEELGYNYRMSNIIAGIVRGQALHLNEHIAAKRAIYERYKAGFKAAGLPVAMNPYDVTNSVPNFWLSCLIVDADAMCKQTRGELDFSYTSEPGKSCPQEILDNLSTINVEGRPVWKPMHMQPIYRDNPFVTRFGDGIDVGNDIFTRGVCLPSDIKMTPEEQDIIIQTIVECFA